MSSTSRRRAQQTDIKLRIHAGNLHAKGRFYTSSIKQWHHKKMFSNSGTKNGFNQEL
jgi:hypothetical protein